MLLATFILLAAAAAAYAYRLVVGPSITDRAIALNGLVLVGMGGIAAHAIFTGEGAFLPTLVAIALVGPISTGMVARYIESRGVDG
jgi:multicomponent Na+:H+ antiporter subunit F